MSEEERDSRKREREDEEEGATKEDEPDAKIVKTEDELSAPLQDTIAEGAKVEEDSKPEKPNGDNGECKTEVNQSEVNNQKSESQQPEEDPKQPEEEVSGQVPETEEPLATSGEEVQDDNKEVEENNEPETSVESGTLPIVIDRVGQEPEPVPVSLPVQPVDATAPVTAPPATHPVASQPSGVIPGLPPTYTGASTTNPPQAYTMAPMYQNPDEMLEERCEVSRLYIGRVIGKGGEMIRDLQARSGAQMDMDQTVPSDRPAIIVIKGPRRKVEFAKQLVAMLSQDGVSESSLPLGEAKREILTIPARSVGKIIGRSGDMIRELQSRSLAKIQVDHHGSSGLPSDQKQVTIIGTDQAVRKAKELVEFLVANPLVEASLSVTMLEEEKSRSGTPWGTGPPYPTLPNQGQNMQPYMVGQQSAYGGGPADYGGGGATPMYGSVYTPQPNMGRGVGAGPAAVVAPYQQQRQRPGFNQYAGSQKELDVVYVQKQFMGRIIGQKGVTVNDLQRRSGSDIQINQNVPPGSDCEITIRGTREAIEMAKSMIQEIIQVGPQHPYAGGAESYGGGMGAYQQQQQPYANTYAPQQSYGYQQQGYGTQSAQGGQAWYGNTSAYGANQQYDSQQTYYGGYSQGQSMPAAYQQSSFPTAAAPAAPPLIAHAPPPIVSAWKAATSPDGQVYYYNEQTGQTQWEKPPGMP